MPVFFTDLSYRGILCFATPYSIEVPFFLKVWFFIYAFGIVCFVVKVSDFTIRYATKFLALELCMIILPSAT